MSKLPFVLTLVISGSLLVWVVQTPDPPGKDRPSAKVKARPVAGSAAGAPLPAVREPIYGYPDPRGILLELRQRGGTCKAAAFRSQSPVFVLWDDGSVVTMSSTFDYRRGRVSIARASGWSREFQSIAAGRTGITCGILRDRSAQGDVISLRGRIGNGGELSLVGPNLLFGNVAHAETCLDCAALAPLARLLHELQQQRKCGEQNETLTGIPMEVYLEWRSCGCRNHPEIVNVSKEWPLGGARPAERCGRQSAQFRLEDPSDIRMLSEAIAQSAAVLDREEIYTCFMRPLLEPVKERALALR